jgi:fucose permease
MGVRLSGTSLSWGGMYLIMMSLAVIPMIPSVFSRFPEETADKEDRMSYAAFARDPAAWLIVAILSFGVTSEMAVGGWLVNFLEKAYNWSPAAASGMLSAFFLCFTLARLVLGPVTDRIGFVRSLIIFSGFSGVCTLSAIIAGERGAFLFAAAGIGIAPIYPTVMAYLAKRYAGRSDVAITFTVTLLGIASVVGNLLIGAITEWFKHLYTGTDEAGIGVLRGLQAGYAFIGICALLCAATSAVLYRFLRKRGEELI